ncbi:hemophore-related protein [Nocardia sp. Marseille-Q1738]
MKLFRSRSAFVPLLSTGFAIIALVLGTATASADPMQRAEPLLTANCTFAQADAALHVESPQLAAALDSYPTFKADLRRKFDQPVEQRRAALRQMIEQNPELARELDESPRWAHLRNAVLAVAVTCANY